MKETGHISRHYDGQLAHVKELLLEMGGRIENMVSDSIRALVEKDTDLAIDVRGRDAEIDRLQKEVDEHCIQILALRQPTAVDLRLVAAALKIVQDLERIGDLMVNFCERTEELNSMSQVKPYRRLPRMAELASAMVTGALDAFLAGDAGAAEEVLDQDQMVDDLHLQILQDIIERTVKDPKIIRAAMALLFSSRYIERVADHATNIAEMVIYMVEGKDVRHSGGH